jgi:WD40 repeat protein
MHDSEQQPENQQTPPDGQLTSISLGNTERRIVLGAFARALSQESHVLSRRPELVWQQCFNRLQWNSAPVLQVLAAELSRRTAARDAPWLRLAAPTGESTALIRTLSGQGAHNLSCVFTPSGEQLISAGDDHVLHTWYTRTGQLVTTLKGHEASVNSCAVSPDGLTLLSASSDGTARLWDLVAGQPQASLFGYAGAMFTGSFSPDGASFVVGGDRGTLQRRSRNGDWQCDFIGHTGGVRTCTFSPNGRFLASGSDDRTVCIWDAHTGGLLNTLHGHTGWVLSCVWRPDGIVCVSGDSNGSLILWDIVEGRALQSRKAYRRSVRSCVFDPVRNVLFSAGAEGIVMLWDGSTFQHLGTVAGHTSSINACTVSQDGSLLATASDDRTIKLWDVASIQGEMPVAGAHQRTITECHFNPDGTRLLTGSDDATVKLWDPRTLAVHHTFMQHGKPITSCHFSPDGRTCTTSEFHGYTYLWDVEDGRRLAYIGQSYFMHDGVYSPNGVLVCGMVGEHPTLHDAHSGSLHATLDLDQVHGVLACAFRPDSRVVAVGFTEDRICAIFEVESGHRLATLGPFDSSLCTCAFSPDGGTLVTADSTSLTLWDGITFAYRAHLQFPSPGTRRGEITDCAMSPDGRFLVATWLPNSENYEALFPTSTDETSVAPESTAESEPTLAQWDLITLRLQATVPGRCIWWWVGGGRLKEYFSHDGSTLVAVTDDQSLLLWSVSHARLQGRCVGHTGGISEAVFTPDDKYLISSSHDGSIRVWLASTGEERGFIPLPGTINCLAIHPSGTRIMAGGSAAVLYSLDLVGARR